MEFRRVLFQSRALQIYEQIKADFGHRVSLADLIVLGGSVGIEQAAKAAGRDITVPFVSGRGDATAEQTDANSFEPLEPKADGFRDYLSVRFSVPTEELLVDRSEEHKSELQSQLRIPYAVF